MKEQRLFSIQGVYFGRKQIDRGIVLKTPSDRHYKSLKDERGVKVSQDTSHKSWKSRSHYVSMHDLEIGEVYELRETEREAKTAKVLTLKLLEMSTFHALFEELEVREEQKRQRAKKPQTIETGVYFEEEPLTDSRPKKRKKGIFGRTAGEQLSPDQIKFCVEFGVFDRKKPVILERGDDLRYQQKSDLFFIHDPKNKGRLGNPYRKITPDSIQGESFVYNGKYYDIITGREAGKPGTSKPSPRYKRI